MIIRKNIAILLSLMLIIAACNSSDDIFTEEPTMVATERTINFNLTASHPDDGGAAQTRAVKQGWEAGDAIFVFFSGAAAPRHLKMTFDGSAWTSAEYDGATLIPGALELKNGDTGTMRAVYLPFGSAATVSASGTSFTFSTTYYTYYATATLPYMVVDHTVSGAFNMTIPEGYVQFFVEDAAATNEGYTLGTDAVIPTGVASIAADGTIAETSDKSAADDMPGYAYSGGYLFSGKLNNSYAYSGKYYFAKTKTADNSRADYFVTGKAIDSHSAVKLPANNNVYSTINTSGKWVPVGLEVKVHLSNDDGTDLGTWATCNALQSVPEAPGHSWAWIDAYEKFHLPSVSKFNKITGKKNTGQKNTGLKKTVITYNCTWTIMSIHGYQGLVVKANHGFLFLPECWYWSNDWANGDHIYYLDATTGGRGVVRDCYQSWMFPVVRSGYDNY